MDAPGPATRGERGRPPFCSPLIVPAEAMALTTAACWWLCACVLQMCLASFIVDWYVSTRAMRSPCCTGEGVRGRTIPGGPDAESMNRVAFRLAPLCGTPSWTALLCLATSWPVLLLHTRSASPCVRPLVALLHTFIVHVDAHATSHKQALFQLP